MTRYIPGAAVLAAGICLLAAGGPFIAGMALLCAGGLLLRPPKQH